MDDQKRSKKARLEPAHWTFEEKFPHPFIAGDYGAGAAPRTVMELSMMKMSASIRRKRDWLLKMNDAVIISRWKKEAMDQGLTQAQADYVIEELEYYSAMRKGTIEPAAVDGVWQADVLIPADRKQSLVEAVAKLENVPESEKDWHPGSNRQVLDLVHPSLFCLVYGVSKRTRDPVIQPLDFVGAGEVIPAPSGHFSYSYSLSKKYQWLPSDFHVDESGKVTIESYINNLHPEDHRGTYSILAEIFGLCVPLLNEVLTDLVNPRPYRITADPYNWYRENPEEQEEEDPNSDDDEDDWFSGKELIYPDAPPFQMPDVSRRIPVDLRGRTLQVIVKLANIELSPENPCYPGGSWHVEGMTNENIVASAIYYYSSENVTESKLHFRQAVREPDYEQFDHRGVREIFGLVDEGPLNQELGAVITREDRCIAFPNVLQHRVAPFELVHKTKRGYRKILVFFLVDPEERIISTLNVPPQQKSWLLPVLRSTGPFQSLPQELLEHIVDLLPWPMSLEEAKSHREKLMEERKYFVSENNENYFERPFSLCEH